MAQVGSLSSGHYILPAREHVQLGVDFGSTRIVRAAADWCPSLVALRGDQRRYGWDAWLVPAEPGRTAARSLKRSLEDAGADTRLPGARPRR